MTVVLITAFVALIGAAFRPKFRALLLIEAVLLFPFLPFVPSSLLGKINFGASYALIAISLVVLTGWSGNISLGHSAFVGVGAFVTGILMQRFHVPFPVNMLWAGAAGAAAAAFLGIFALRIRGLYLAIATLIFAWMAQEFLFRQKGFVKAASVDVIPFGRPGTFPYFDWTNRTTFYFGAWASVIAVVFMCSHLRRSKSGRALFAVRGSEVAAASLGINVVRTKLMAFALSGAVAGAAGNIAMLALQVVTQDQFDVSRSLFYLSIAVVGGLQSVGGAIAGALLFAGLDEVFLRVEQLGGYLDIVSTFLLAITLLFFREGLAGIPLALGRVIRSRGIRVETIDEKLSGWSAKVISELRRLTGFKEKKAVSGPPSNPKSVGGSRGKAARVEPPLDLFSIHLPGEPSISPNGREPKVVPEVAEASSGVEEFHFAPLPFTLPSERGERRPMIEAEEITVQFGGLTAVSEFSLTVREGEIVGLIGPNGAGKTTLFNSIAGLNVPTNGRVKLFGQDVTDFQVHERARLGVGRTFQAIQLFSNLDVFDNLLVATHMQNETGLGSHLFVTGKALEAERYARAQVNRALQLLELQSVANRRVSDLPFGVLRMVEVARALVTGSRIIMLDEPASGLDNTETERLSDILKFVRSLGVTLLLIEHDVQMVTSVSDYMYVIERGKFLAEGLPSEIKRDPLVIAAYLGESHAEAREREKAAV